jgi:hypothetical protein
VKTTYDDQHRVAILNSGQTIYAVHKSTQCLGEVCPIHKPSDHDLVDAPLTYDPMIGSFFREVSGEKVIDPDDYNFNKFGEVIVRNAITCLDCNDTVVSTHRHHMATCSCGESSADGGSAYLRRVGANWVEASTVFTR